MPVLKREDDRLALIEARANHPAAVAGASALGHIESSATLAGAASRRFSATIAACVY